MLECVFSSRRVHTSCDGSSDVASVDLCDGRTPTGGGEGKRGEERVGGTGEGGGGEEGWGGREEIAGGSESE